MLSAAKPTIGGPVRYARYPTALTRAVIAAAVPPDRPARCTASGNTGPSARPVTPIATTMPSASPTALATGTRQHSTTATTVKT